LQHIWGKFSPETGIPPYGDSKEDGAEDKGDEEEDTSVASEQPQSEPGFEILDLGVDRRLLVNRQKKLKMYRCWMQGRFMKKSTTGAAS
ncbi:hypothetical protein KEM55_000966, partial [Ascosphaera atra]